MNETKCRKCGETCVTVTLEAFACDNCGDEYRTVREPGYSQLETELAYKDKQLAEARAEIERLSSRDGNAKHELVYDDGDNPFAREKLEHVDFGVCDNQYVLESHLLNNALEGLKAKDKLLSIVGEVANNALYFNDNSDYEKALWEILAAAKPELFAECEMPRLKFISISNETAKKGN